MKPNQRTARKICERALSLSLPPSSFSLISLKASESHQGTCNCSARIQKKNEPKRVRLTWACFCYPRDTRATRAVLTLDFSRITIAAVLRRLWGHKPGHREKLWGDCSSPGERWQGVNPSSGDCDWWSNSCWDQKIPRVNPRAWKQLFFFFFWGGWCMMFLNIFNWLPRFKNPETSPFLPNLNFLPLLKCQKI